MSILARRFDPLATPPAPAEPQLTVVPEPAAVPAATSTLKKVNLSGFTKKKDSGKTEYPILPPRPEVTALALRVIEDQSQFEALEGALKQNKKLLIEMAAPFHFEFAHGKVVDKSLGILVEADADHKLRIDFKDSYPMLESERALVPIIGQPAVDAHFHQTFTFKIEGDKLPADHVGAIVGELQELFARHNASDALTVKEGIIPNADFHLKRHQLFSPLTNLRLNDVCPIRAAVATKNIK